MRNSDSLPVSTEGLPAMRRAQQHLDDVFVLIPEHLLEVGLSEKEVAQKLDVFLTAEGKFPLAFPTIVAFGESAAEPHHVPGERTLQPREHVLIDCGVKIDGWCADCTRNFFVGDPDPEFLETFDRLLEIHEAVLPQFVPGTPVQKLDQWVRDQMGDWAKFFPHSLGHGVGQAVHEEPKISVKSDAILAEGMVVTCEPGWYVPGRWGIRIEDQLVVGRDKPEILSQFPRTLQVIDAWE